MSAQLVHFEAPNAVVSDRAFARAIRADALTPEAERTILVATLNAVAGAVLAHRTGDVDLARWTTGDTTAAGERPWGARGTVSRYDAATINAAAAHAFAYDDTSDVLLGHPTVGIVPAVLAGARGAMSTSDFVRAYASGYETMTTLGRLMNPDHYRKGFHATLTLGSAACANAVSVIRGQDRELGAAAVGIACAQTGGLRASIGHPLRSWHAGFAARRGLESADLAESGVRPNPDTVLGELGFAATFGGRSAAAPEIDADEPAINGRDVLNLKTYPGCGAVGPAASAVIEAMRSLDADVADVVAVDVVVNPFVLDVVSSQWPTSAPAAGFSLLYVVTVALAHGDVAPFHLAATSVGSEELRRLSRLVSLGSGLPSSTKYEARATVTLRDGRVASRQVPGLGGTPVREFSPQDVVARWLPRSADGPSELLVDAATDFIAGGETDFRARLDALLRALERSIVADGSSP